MSTIKRTYHAVDIENILALTHGMAIGLRAGELYKAIVGFGPGDLIEVAPTSPVSSRPGRHSPAPRSSTVWAVTEPTAPSSPASTSTTSLVVSTASPSPVAIMPSSTSPTGRADVVWR